MGRPDERLTACPRCERTVPVNKDGRIAKHPPKVDGYIQREARCRGSGVVAAASWGRGEMPVVAEG